MNFKSGNTFRTNDSLIKMKTKGIKPLDFSNTFTPKQIFDLGHGLLALANTLMMMLSEKKGSEEVKDNHVSMPTLPDNPQREIDVLSYDIVNINDIEASKVEVNVDDNESIDGGDTDTESVSSGIKENMKETMSNAPDIVTIETKESTEKTLTDNVPFEIVEVNLKEISSLEMNTDFIDENNTLDSLSNQIIDFDYTSKGNNDVFTVFNSMLDTLKELETSVYPSIQLRIKEMKEDIVTILNDKIDEINTFLNDVDREVRTINTPNNSIEHSYIQTSHDLILATKEYNNEISAFISSDCCPDPSYNMFGAPSDAKLDDVMFGMLNSDTLPSLKNITDLSYDILFLNLESSNIITPTSNGMFKLTEDFSPKDLDKFIKLVDSTPQFNINGCDRKNVKTELSIFITELLTLKDSRMNAIVSTITDEKKVTPPALQAVLEKNNKISKYSLQQLDYKKALDSSRETHLKIYDIAEKLKNNEVSMTLKPFNYSGDGNINSYFKNETLISVCKNVDTIKSEIKQVEQKAKNLETNYKTKDEEVQNNALFGANKLFTSVLNSLLTPGTVIKDVINEGVSSANKERGTKKVESFIQGSGKAMCNFTLKTIEWSLGPIGTVGHFAKDHLETKDLHRALGRMADDMSDYSRSSRRRAGELDKTDFQNVPPLSGGLVASSKDISENTFNLLKKMNVINDNGSVDVKTLLTADLDIEKELATIIKLSYAKNKPSFSKLSKLDQDAKVSKHVKIFLENVLKKTQRVGTVKGLQYDLAKNKSRLDTVKNLGGWVAAWAGITSVVAAPAVLAVGMVSGAASMGASFLKVPVGMAELVKAEQAHNESFQDIPVLKLNEFGKKSYLDSKVHLTEIRSQIVEDLIHGVAMAASIGGAAALTDALNGDFSLKNSVSADTHSAAFDVAHVSAANETGAVGAVAAMNFADMQQAAISQDNSKFLSTISKIGEGMLSSTQEALGAM